jgi:hypothetical protein
MKIYSQHGHLAVSPHDDVTGPPDPQEATDRPGLWHFAQGRTQEYGEAWQYRSHGRERVRAVCIKRERARTVMI